MKRNIFGMLFAVTVLVVSMGVTAFAGQNEKVETAETEEQDEELVTASTVVDSGKCGINGGDNLTWELTEDGVLTISGTGGMDHRWSAWAWSETVKRVIIEEGVENIGGYAFYECEDLTEINIPESVMSIGGCAFYNCSRLAKIKLPEGVTSIGESAFWGCKSLTEINIPESVMSIGESAFYNCSSLVEINIPESVTSIGGCAFSGVGAAITITYNPDEISGYEEVKGHLKKVIFKEGMTELPSEVLSGETGLTEVMLSESVTSIGESAFYNCSSLVEINIPESVTNIGESAFYNCSSLKDIELPSSVTNIGESVFYGCSSLVEINILESVTNIEESAFYNCSSLKDIELPSSVTSIGESAFYGCSSLVEINIPESVTSIGKEAFSGVGAAITITYNSDEISGYEKVKGHLKKVIFKEGMTELPSEVLSGETGLMEVVIPDSVTSIGWEAFYNCISLKEILLPSSVNSIGSNAFYGCRSLTEIKLPEGVTSIGLNAFYGCRSLTEIKLPEGITSIAKGTFSGCSYLEEVELPSSMIDIGESAFYNCSRLVKIKLPEGVTSIGKNAFQNCRSLTEINIPESVTAIGANAFSNVGAVITITYNPDEISGYEEVKGHLKKVIFKEGTTEIPSEVLSGETGLVEVVIPDSVTSIGGKAFYNCSSLEKVNLPPKLKSLRYNAFGNCKSLKEIRIPSSLESSYLAVSTAVPFYGCSNLIKVIFEEGRTSIPSAILAYSGGVEEIILPNTLTNIGEWAFFECSKLTKINFPVALESIDDGAFCECSSLKKVEIPKRVSTIGDCVFEDCWNLEEIKIPKNLIEAGENIFSGCSLKTINFEEGTDTIIENLFYGAGIQQIELPESITMIEDYAFQHSSLKQIELSESLEYIGESAFSDCSDLTEVKIPAETTLYAFVFENCSALTKIDITGNEEISEGTFKNCALLSEVIGSEEVECIRDEAFYNCDALQEISLPKSLVYIGENTFYDCDALQTVTMQEGVTYIDNKAFWDCDSLTAITIPDTVTSVGEYAFYGCDALAEATLGYGIQELPDYTFGFCTSLEEVKLPYLTHTLGSGAFNGCDALTSVTMPRKLTTIAEDAFSNTEGLTIYGINGTYAQEYAKEHDITFVHREIPVTSLSFAETEVTADIRKELQLQVLVQPYYFNDELVWSSDDSSIATVESDGFLNGTIRGISQGMTTIRVSAGSVSASVQVTVGKWVENITVTGVSVLETGETARFTAAVLPENATNPAIRWESSDETVAAVNTNGVVTALKAGNVEIRAVAVDGSGIKGSYALQVKAPVAAETIEELQSAHPYKNNFKGTWVYTKPGETELYVTFSADTYLEYNCDYLEIYDKDGRLVGRYTGTQLAGKEVKVPGDTLKIKLLTDGANAYYGFKVNSVKGVLEKEEESRKPVKEITITGVSTMKTGEMAEFMASVLPTDAYNPEVHWESSDETVAAVNADGVVNALKAGIVEIRAVAVDGSGVSGKFTVTIVNKEILAESISFAEEEIQIGVDGEKQLQAVVQPENYTQKLSWSSADPSIAKVDAYGIVKGLKKGSTTIHVSVGSLTASMKVTVVQPVTEITVTGVSTLEVGKKARFTTAVLPEDADHQEVRWESSDAAVATVNKDGVVNALKAGTVEIRAVAEDGFGAVGSRIVLVKEKEVYYYKEEIQSSHPYENDSSRTWRYTKPGAAGILAVFSDLSVLENNRDYVEITDKEGNMIGRYTGKELAGTTVLIPGNTMNLQLITDSAGTEYGFAVESIEGIFENTEESVEVPGEHPGDVAEEDLPEEGAEFVPEGLWIAGVEKAGYAYTGKAIKPEVRVYHHKKLLTEKKDYVVSYKNNVKASGDAQIVVKGKGNYGGSAVKNFTINPLDIQGEDFVADHMAVLSKNGREQKPVPTVLWKGKKLKAGKDFSVSYPDTASGAYIQAGTYTVSVNGIKNFSGSRKVQLEITDENLISKVSVSGLKKQEYTGKPKEPGVLVQDGNTILAEGKDYDISYEDNTDVGTAYLILTGKGSWHGQKRLSFKITGQNLKGASVSGLSNVTYTGREQRPEVVVQAKVGGLYQTLVKGKDYTVTYSGNTNAGKATVIITGKGNYTGQIKKTFTIAKYNLNNETFGNRKLKVEMEKKTAYVKGGSCPKPMIVFGGKLLTEGVDYTLSYKNHKVLSDGSGSEAPVMIIKGKGNLTGSTSVTFAITKAEIGNLTMEVPDKVYSAKVNGAISKPKVIDVDGKKLKADIDYEKNPVYTYKNDTTLVNGTERKAGEEVKTTDIVPTGTVISVTVKGLGNYTGTLTREHRILADASKDIKKAKVDKIEAKIYTGKAITLLESEIKVKVGGSYLKEGEYEIVSESYKNNVKKGKASVTIRGLGEYGGTKTVTFSIKAKPFEWWKGFSLKTLFE